MTIAIGGGIAALVLSFKVAEFMSSITFTSVGEMGVFGGVALSGECRT